MGTREFTDETERKRRRDRVAAIGERVWGASWQTPLAEALVEATGRPLGRARVAQWMLASDPKPVPAWVLDALPAIARTGAARLRVAADELDVLAADDGAPPAPHGEPESDGEGPQESGPAAADAADDDTEIDAFVAAVCSEPPRLLDALPQPELHWQHTRATGWVRRPLRGY